jgi:hypothetical protein
MQEDRFLAFRGSGHLQCDCLGYDAVKYAHSPICFQQHNSVDDRKVHAMLLQFPRSTRVVLEQDGLLCGLEWPFLTILPL